MIKYGLNVRFIYLFICNFLIFYRTLYFLLRKHKGKKIIRKPPMLFTLVLNSYNAMRRYD